MRDFITSIKQRLVGLPSILAVLWVCLAFVHGPKAYGQNVTISPSTGSLIAGVTYDGEVGFQNGSSSLWRHNQLPLTLHVSDKGDLTPGGVLKDPAGDIRLDDVSNQGYYLLHGGNSVSTHLSISLPKGYRFTGYCMVLLNNMNNKKVANLNREAVNKRMYETNSAFDITTSLASTAVMGSSNETKDYVIERTSKTDTDMGNNLYFYFWKARDAYYACTIKSIELYFTAESKFQAEGVPGTPDEIISEGVNMVGSEFTTGKLDLGIIQPNTKSGSTYYSYNYNNVIDLTAKNWLYQENAVTADKKLPETAGSGNIQVLQNEGQLYYALGNGTYYIETPTETKNQNGKSIPLGYRITGAQIKGHYGTAAGSTTVNYDGKTGTISYKTSGRRGTTYYLQTDGTWETSPQTKWTLTKANKLQSGNYYLTVQKFTSGGRSSYIANGTTNKDEASNFTISNNQVKYGDLYLSLYYTDRARFYSDNDYAATWTASTGSATNPAYTPSDFTIRLYGTSGSEVETMTKVSSSNKDAIAEVDGLNNDAVKFTISGLADGSKALITYNLKMEQLNPFINTLDIVCHSKKMQGKTITQQFTSNDFQVAGGAFHFYVPSAFADANNNCTFTFENLTSKFMDDTYGHGTTGNSRNYFVKSDYYNTYGDGKQYTATGNEEASTKVSTKMCADQPFKYNNANELANDNVSATAATLEENPYSEALYTASDGSGTSTGVPGTFTGDIELAVNSAAKDCYLTTGDETRYNIAPTTAMEHRYYAFYKMEIDLQVKEYDAYCRTTKLYEKTYYGDGLEKPMYGGTFEAYEKGHGGDTDYQIPSEQAFLSVDMMVKALQDAETRDGFTADQVLYLDYTDLYSVIVESQENMAKMKAELNPNCLIFFPQRTVYNEDNYVSKTLSGDFRACKNIVITDKQPFYSPYKISVPAENYAAYQRKITTSMNGKATLATLVLPFSIEVSGGVHANDRCRISLYQMQADGGLSADSEEGNTGKDFWGKAQFKPIEVKRTVPNTPYVVKVEEASSGEDVTFEVLQYGSDVDATVNSEAESGNYMNSDYTFTGEHATGTIGSVSHAFTHYGSYSGKKLDKNGGWFYFGQGKFYNSKNLGSQYDYVNVRPFRAYFGHESSSSAKLMVGFNVAFGDDLTTGIDNLSVDTSAEGLQLSTSHGQLTMKASEPTDVEVYSAAGVTMLHTALGAGETKTFALNSGLYIVNGKKVIIP